MMMMTMMMVMTMMMTMMMTRGMMKTLRRQGWEAVVELKAS